MSYLALSIVFIVVSFLVMYAVAYFADENPKLGWCAGAALIIGVVSLLLNWLGCPAIAYNTITGYIELAFVLAVSTGLGMLFAETENMNKASIAGFGGVGVIFLGLCLTGLYQWNLFHAGYKQTMLNPEVIELADADSTILGQDSIIAATSNKDICIISPEMAKKSGMTKLGDLRNVYEIGDFTKQSASCDFWAETTDGVKHISYKNHLVYVALLEHKGFLTWLKNSYSPGYVLVDACNPSKFWVITGIGTTKNNIKPLEIKYTNGFWWGNQDIERHMRLNGYTNVILSDFDMEINEKGVPYAPVTTIENTIGFSTPMVTGVALVNLINGNIKWYEPAKAPTFVNMIQTKDITYRLMKWYGDYIYGYIHWTEKAGLTKPCSGMDVVQTPKGCYYYVGISAQGDDVATQGYMLTDTRTGKTTYYRRQGVSEAEAIKVLSTPQELNLQIERKVIEMTEPVFYSIEGVPTYFTTYVSPVDLQAKFYGFCSSIDRSIWGYGETLELAKRNYLEACFGAEGKNVVDFSDAQNLTFVEVKVLEKTNIDKVFYFRFDGYKDKVFTAELRPELSDMLWETQGRKVKVSFNKTDSSKFVTLSSYEIMN